MDTKDERALEALLALAFRQEITDAQAVKLFNEPVILSAEDRAAMDSVDIEAILKNGPRVQN